MLGKKFVTQINFSGNNIGAEGCACLAHMLSDPQCGVKVLDLSNNPQINDEAIMELCKCFPINHSLKELYLQQTSMTNVAVR